MTAPLNTRLHLEDSAPQAGPDLPVLVLGNSLGSTREIWSAVLPKLTPHMRVISYEHWGHGASPPSPQGPSTVAQLGQELIDALDTLGVGRAHFAGISLGGIVALWCASHRPERVASLTPICSSAHLVHRNRFAARAREVQTSGLAPMAEAIVGRWCTPGFLANHPQRQAQLTAMVREVDPGGYAACCRALADWNGLDDLERIIAPTRVVTAAQDHAIPEAHGALLAASIPGAQRVHIPLGAHVPVLEQPDMVADLLLQQVLGTRGTPSVTADQDVIPGNPHSIWQETWAQRVERGETVRRAVLGDIHVDRARAAVTPFTAPFQDLVQAYPWGSIWSRPGLSLRERSMITLALLAGLKHDGEFSMHVTAALRNGLSHTQIREVLLHTGVYAGIPTANHAFKLAERVLNEADPGQAGATSED